MLDTWREFVVPAIITHRGSDKMAAILQKIFLNAFSWLENFFDLNFTEICS